MCVTPQGEKVSIKWKRSNRSNNEKRTSTLLDAVVEKEVSCCYPNILSSSTQDMVLIIGALDYLAMPNPDKGICAFQGHGSVDTETPTMRNLPKSLLYPLSNCCPYLIKYYFLLTPFSSYQFIPSQLENDHLTLRLSK